MTKARYITRAYCGGPAQTTVTSDTADEAIAVAAKWQTDMPEALNIVVYGPRLTKAGDYEIFRFDRPINRISLTGSQ